MTQEEKQKAMEILREGFDNQMGTLFMVEERLGQYVRGLMDSRCRQLNKKWVWRHHC